MGKIISVGNIPKLTKEQNRILDEIIHGAEIQSTYENGKVVYDLVYDNGNIEVVRSDTFNRLKSTGLITLKWRPSIDIERWS